jgi:hypothetical protein
VRRGLLLLLAAALAALLPRGAALARPAYFDVFTSKYGLVEGDRTYACGNCHYKWTGTGARNPFGSTVEQQIYLGKPISQAIDDAVVEDPDGDGFTSLEEITIWRTLPGYNCENFVDAIDPPADWHSFITPGVESCLEPKDIRVAPTAFSFQTDAGKSETATLTIFNNGRQDPIEVDSYGFLAGTDPALSVSGPVTPLTLQVGETATLEVLFAPTGVLLANATLRIASDDPDEPSLDVPVSALGRVRPLAPAERREACQRDIEREARRYTKTHLKLWARCFADEGEGFACDVGRRERKSLAAEARLRDVIGGARDKHCASAHLSPGLLGHPERCAGGCSSIELRSFGDLADCLVCRQQEAADAMLDAVQGAVPPDLPPVVSGRTARCQAHLLKALRKGIGDAQRRLGACELANLTATSPADCGQALSGELETLRARVDTRLARCRDTTGLAGCYADGGEPGCLGAAATAVGSDLVDAEFGLDAAE